MSAKKKQSKAEQLAALRKVKPAKKEKPAAKAAKAKPVKLVKTAKAKKAKKQDENPGVGHNSGEVNVPLQEALGRIEAIRDNKKELAKAERDEIARIKTEFNVSSAVIKHELRLRQMDSDVRAQFEHGHNDLKGMLGIQLSLALDAPEGDGDGLGEDGHGLGPDRDEEQQGGEGTSEGDNDGDRYTAGRVN